MNENHQKKKRKTIRDPSFSPKYMALLNIFQLSQDQDGIHKLQEMLEEGGEDAVNAVFNSVKENVHNILNCMNIELYECI